MAPATVTTRILILSDTFPRDDDEPPFRPIFPPVDILIHCGNLTRHSSIDEYEKAYHLLNRIDAQLKLVVTGDNDTILTRGPRFQRERRPLPGYLRICQYFASTNINLLHNGVHEFTLGNGANLRVYAHSGTPRGSPTEFNSSRRAMEEGAPRGPRPGFLATIPHRDYTLADHQDIDIVITHEAPQFVLDKDPDGRHVGSQQLLNETATTRPLLHCFGGVPDCWGALLFHWRGEGGEELRQGQAPNPQNSRF